MIRLAYVVLLAGCPAKKTTPEPQGAGCPTAAGVYAASFVTQDKGRSGWVIPLHAINSQAEVAAYANVDAATASAAGVPAAPTGSMWLITQAGAPCQAKAGNYYAAKIEGPPASVSYGVEVDGCPTPKNPEEGGIVLVSASAPTGCRFEQPRPVAARIGQMDAQKQWQRPTKETAPIPPQIVVSDKECTAPACEKLWAFVDVKINNQTAVWAGVINWLKIGAPADQCSWPSERESGIWIPSGNGATKVTEGQQHPLPLSAVLADGGGAKVILAEGPGEYATYDLAGGAARLGHRIVWQIVPPEIWDQVDNLGPFCEPKR